MKHLLDTNIVLRLADRDAESGVVALRALEALLAAGSTLCISPQIIHEAWATFTRPKSANGFGLTAKAARVEIDEMLKTYTMVVETLAVFQAWLHLCTIHSITGRAAFDARLAAMVVVDGFDGLVTLNAPDFRPFPGVTLVVPA